MEKVDILGVGIDNLSLQEVLEKITHFLQSKNQHFIVTPNPEFLVVAGKDKQFKEVLNYADIAVSDGVGLLYAAKFNKKKLVRVTGVDLAWAISELASEKSWPVYFLGAVEEVAEATAKVLTDQFPELNVVGAQSGGEITTGATNYNIINEINIAKPKILFVAFGQIKQEKWIFNNLDKLPSVKVAIGVGGAFDYISGVTPRAPKFLQRLGLEWLFRLTKEPKRYKRIINAVIVFPFLIIKKRLLGRFQEVTEISDTKDQG